MPRYAVASMLVCLVLMAVSAQVTGQGNRQGQSTSGLSRLLEAEFSRLPAKAGVYVKHLQSGEEALLRPDDDFNTYSVIKLPLMVMAFELADEKKLDLSERHTIQRTDWRPGSGIIRWQDPGTNLTVRDLVLQMIITSDNTATDVVLARVGGPAAVNAWLASKGFPKMRLAGSTLDLFRRRYESMDPPFRNLSLDELLSGTVRRRAGLPPETTEQAIRREANPDNWLGVMTPRDTGRLLEALERGKLASPASTEQMRTMLMVQQLGQRRIPHYLPGNMAVAHKTGDGPPTIANDVGIVYARSGPIIMAFFTADMRGLWQDAEEQIGRAARLVVDYFDGAASR